MKSSFLCSFVLFSSFLSLPTYASSYLKPSVFESEKGVKAFVLQYESDTNAYLVKLTGTKTILDNTIIEVRKNEGSGGINTLDALVYGGKSNIFNVGEEYSPKKMEFVNPDTEEKTLLSYDKLDSEESKYTEIDMLKEFKSEKNKDKLSLIREFNRKKLENKFNNYAKDAAKKVSDMCKIEPFSVSYDWTKVADKEMETWKTYYCYGAITSIGSYCFSDNQKHKDVVKNNIKNFLCIPTDYKDKNQYAKMNGNKVEFYYTENTVNIDDYTKIFLESQDFNK